MTEPHVRSALAAETLTTRRQGDCEWMWDMLVPDRGSSICTMFISVTNKAETN